MSAGGDSSKLSRTTVREAPRSFGRSLVAPFAFGLLVSYIWTVTGAGLIQLQGRGAFASVNPLTLLVALGLLYFVAPGAAMALSTRGDARFWGQGLLARVGAWLWLVLALALGFLIAIVPIWLLISRYSPVNRAYMTLAILYGLAAQPGVPFYSLGGIAGLAGLSGLSGLAAAFSFSRWPALSRRNSALAQVGRWLLIGLMTGLGLALIGAAYSLTLRAVFIAHFWPPESGACSGPGCTLGGQISLALGPSGVVVGAALVGSAIGGALRLRPLLLRHPDPPASVPQAMPEAVSAAAPSGGAGRFVGPLGLGVLYGICWSGAAALDVGIRAVPRPIWAAPTTAILVVSSALLVLLLPALVVIVSLSRSGRSTAAQAGAVGIGGKQRALLWLALFLTALPAFVVLAVPNQSYNSTRFAVLLAFLPLITPVLPLTIAVGFAWGAGQGANRPWWQVGLRAALAAGLGLALLFLALTVIVIVSYPALLGPCHGLGGCNIAGAIYIGLVTALGTTTIASVAYALLGGAVGAALRRTHAGILPGT